MKHGKLPATQARSASKRLILAAPSGSRCCNGDLMIYSENSMENRIKGRFVPGVSGNPGGRPKGTLRCEIKRLMEQDFPEVLQEGEQSRTYLEVFVLTLVELALRGHPQAIREVCGRFDGAIPQTVDIDDKRDRPVIQVHWVSPDDGKPEESRTQ